MPPCRRGPDQFLPIFEKIKVVPISISYEYDPTMFENAELPAKSNGWKIREQVNEDFQTFSRGLIGTKITNPPTSKMVCYWGIKEISIWIRFGWRKLSRLAAIIDQKIWLAIKLWPSNFIASWSSLWRCKEFKHEYPSRKKSFLKNRLPRKSRTSKWILWWRAFYRCTPYPVIT